MRRLNTIVSIATAILVVGLSAAVVVLIAQNQQQDAELLAQGRAAIQQNVGARYDDCQNSEAVRSALRQQVEDGKRTDPVLYRLVPSLNTPEVRAIIKASRVFQLKAYAPRDCEAYALASVPPMSRDEYQVP